MKATRKAILALIKAETSLVFTTYYTGFPALPLKEHMPAVAVFSRAEEPDWHSTGFNKSGLEMVVEIYCDASEEIFAHDRGEANEDWLNDTAEAIQELIFTDDEPTANVILCKPGRTEYNVREGNIRVATMLVTAEKRMER